MKAGIIPVIVLISSAALTACTGKTGRDYFAGTLVYAYTYESNVLNTDSLARERPAKGIFRYDEYNYQSRFIGKDTFTYNYSGRLNKCVSAYGNGNEYTCEDYSNSTDSVLSWKYYDTDEKIMGQVCSVLELQKKNSWVRYYVSRESSIAPATYKKHHSYNMDFYGEKAGGGLILKLEHRFKTFTMKGVAVAADRENENFYAFDMTDKKIKQICSSAQ